MADLEIPRTGPGGTTIRFCINLKEFGPAGGVGRGGSVQNFAM